MAKRSIYAMSVLLLLVIGLAPWQTVVAGSAINESGTKPLSANWAAFSDLNRENVSSNQLMSSASAVTAGQVYYTSRIRFRSQWYFTYLTVCGHNTQNRYVCRRAPDRGYVKDITWWLRPDRRIYVAVYLRDYGWRYCQAGVSLPPPYSGGWVTITYLGGGRCSIRNGLR